MKHYIICVVFLCICSVNSENISEDGQDGNKSDVIEPYNWRFSREILDSSQITKTDNDTTLKAEDELARKIYLIIDHFKQDDPVGLPGGLLPIPDPAVLIQVQKVFKIKQFSPKACSWYCTKYINGQPQNDKRQTARNFSIQNQIHQHRN